MLRPIADLVVSDLLVSESVVSGLLASEPVSSGLWWWWSAVIVLVVLTLVSAVSFVLVLRRTKPIRKYVEPSHPKEPITNE